MNDYSSNLLNALFDLFPGDTAIPRENFLSEAFAHVLRESPPARDRWTSRILKELVSWAYCKINTRPSEQSQRNSKVFPDMLIEGMLSDGRQVAIYFEHKWGAKFDPGQISDYADVAQKREQKERINTCLAFVGSNSRQVTDARRSKHLGADQIYLWEDVYTELESIPDRNQNLTQFLEFMETHGLNPGKPIDQFTMVAFIQAKGFEESLERAANKLKDEFDWDFFPKRFLGEPKVTNRWGRIAIQFSTPAWMPTITVGFLFDERDHKVSFINPKKGIDLLLRIEAGPNDQKNIAPALAELRHKREKHSSLAASVLLLRERGNGNAHSLLIVRSCLGDVIEKTATQQAQLEAIHETLKGWGEALFGDGALEKAFKQAGLNSGM